MKRIHPLPLAVALFLFIPTLGSAKDSPYEDKVWVVMKPVQCLGNPWEKEWLGKHHNQGTQYPKAKEFEILRSYFKRNGVPILGLRMKPYMKGEPLSPACDASRGDTLYLLIQASDALRMVDLGYPERLPAKDIPQKK